MPLFLFLGGAFLLTFLLGILLEKIRVPWIFAALILGLGLAFWNPFQEVTNSATFEFLAELGIYFLLFLVGFKLDLAKINKLRKFIVKSALFIILSEALFGSLLIHFIFGYSWFVSVLVALSFATVGEAILIPILDEFRVTKTKLGQTILGIATLDDIIEVLMVVLAVISLPFLTGGGGKEAGFELHSISVISLSLISLFLLTFGLTKLKKGMSLIKFPKMGATFLLILSIFFLFLGIGGIAGITLVSLGALLAGLAVKNFLPAEKIKMVKPYLETVTYGLFGPIFFLWVGIDTDVNYLIAYPLLVLLFIAVAKIVKVSTSYLVGKKELGKKPAIVMGIALGVRLSTSIVIIKILFESGVIGSGLYSVLIGTTIAFKFIIPPLLSYLIPKWKIVR